MLLSVLRRVGSSSGGGPARSIRAIGGLGDVPDTELVERAVSGDARATGELYERHLPYLLGMSVRMLRNRSDGEDVVQEAYALALDRLATLREPSAFRAWVAQIAVSLVRRRLRRRRLLGLLGLDHGSDDATLEALAASSCDGETRAELALVDAALVRLPAAERLAWILRYVEGEELEAVARLTGCSLATAKRRISAAQARMNAHVRFEEDE
jgi:RNA polymerase sigma-70 factor (ECF subfamily)